MRQAWMMAMMVAAGLISTGPAAGSGGGVAAPLTGQWGGERTLLMLTPQGGRIEQDCASGQILGPVRPDAGGHFSVAGRFAEHGPGPQTEPEVPGDVAGQPVRFEGRVVGNRIELVIHQANAQPRLLTLVAGQAVKLIRCY